MLHYTTTHSLVSYNKADEVEMMLSVGIDLKELGGGGEMSMFEILPSD